MGDLLMANLLGVETLRPLDSVPRRGSVAGGATAGVTFDEAVSVTLSGNAGGGNPAEVVARVGREMALLLNQISGSSDLEQRRSLALTFRASVIQALQAAGHAAEAGGSTDKIVVNGQVFDIIGSLNSPGSPVSAQFLRVDGGGYGGGSGGGASGSAREVVFAAGRERQDLLDKMNSAATEAEKTGWGCALRDHIIEALNSAGHSAFEVGKTDKIVINGTVYDIIRAANGLGGQSAVHLLELKPFGESILSDARQAIVHAGSANGALLSQISASSDMAERRSIAEQLRELVLAALRSAGFGAEAHADPDKLVVNGLTYDFIRGLNSPGVAQLQALRV